MNVCRFMASIRVQILEVFASYEPSPGFPLVVVPNQMSLGTSGSGMGFSNASAMVGNLLEDLGMHAGWNWRDADEQSHAEPEAEEGCQAIGVTAAFTEFLERFVVADGLPNGEVGEFGKVESKRLNAISVHAHGARRWFRKPGQRKDRATLRLRGSHARTGTERLQRSGTGIAGGRWGVVFDRELCSRRSTGMRVHGGVRSSVYTASKTGFGRRWRSNNSGWLTRRQGK